MQFFYNKSATYEQLLAEGQSPQPKATGHCRSDINVYIKVKNGPLCPRYVNDLFHTHNNNYNLRNVDFKVPSFNTITYGKHSRKHFGP